MTNPNYICDIMDKDAIVESKKELRKEMLSKRAFITRLSKKAYDTQICDALWRIVEVKIYQVVHVYLPMGTEINITPFIEKLLSHGKTVVAPKTLPKRKLKNLILHSIHEVEQGVFGTTHPSGDEEYTGKYDLVVVPGLAFDSNHYRLGYGAGYYDNFLVTIPDVHKVGIFYPFQRVDQVPIEAHDVPLHQIITFPDVEFRALD